jgi:PKHD-type hydroxylase
MKQYYIRKILDIYQLEKIKSLLEEANKNNLWQDGLNTLSGPNSSHNIKNNLELSDINIAKIINDYIMSSLDRDKNFLNFTVPSSTHLNIVSKTQENGYYKSHTDNWSNGDFSTTVFLNSPQEYEGGELCLYFGGEDEIKIKLDAGWGITYNTGIIHRVNKVKSGSRYASIFWTKTLIKDTFIRNIYSELGNIENILSNYNFHTHLLDCYSSTKNPKFCIENLKQEILRKYS